MTTSEQLLGAAALAQSRQVHFADGGVFDQITTRK